MSATRSIGVTRAPGVVGRRGCDTAGGPPVGASGRGEELAETGQALLGPRPAALLGASGGLVQLGPGRSDAQAAQIHGSAVEATVTSR